MGVDGKNDDAVAEAGVKALEEFYATINMPKDLREAGVREEDLEVISEKAVENGNLGILTSIGKDEALRILREAYWMDTGHS